MKLTLALSLIFVSALSVSAYAVNLDQVSSCLNLPVEDVGTGAKSEMRIELSDLGAVTKVEVVSYSPDSEQGRRIAYKSAEAVVACGPYLGEKGTSNVVFFPDGMLGAGPVISMPDNADGTDNSLANEIQNIIDGK